MRAAVALGLFGLLGCHPALFDLDKLIAIETDNEVARASLVSGVAELGGRVGDLASQHVRAVVECRCQTSVPNSVATACTLGGVIYLCPVSLSCPRCVKHELGHVFGAAHSADPADLMYPIPKPGVESFSVADKKAICASGVVVGGVCD